MSESGLRLNLGCGDRYVAGWVNVDLHTPHQVDQRVDLAGPLPWPPGSVAHVYAGHLLEHLDRAAAGALARRLLQCMNPAGGLLVAVGPDVAVAERMATDGTLDTTYHTLTSIRDGGGRWPGDTHRWQTTGIAVAALLQEAGWPVVANIGLDGLEGSAERDFWPIADRSPRWQYVVRAYVGTPQPW